MDGDLIKLAIKKSGKTQADVAKALNMTRENFNKMLQEEVPDSMVQMITSVGIDLTFVKKSEPHPSDEIKDTVISLAMFLELQQDLQLYRRMISDLMNTGNLTIQKK